MNNMPYKAIKQSAITVTKPVLKVIGLGGGGCNAINRMIELGLTGIEYIAANTDKQALRSSLANTKIQLGPTITRGLGSGGDPNIGEAAAEESYRELSQALIGADIGIFNRRNGRRNRHWIYPDCHKDCQITRCCYRGNRDYTFLF